MLSTWSPGISIWEHNPWHLVDGDWLEAPPFLSFPHCACHSAFIQATHVSRQSPASRWWELKGGRCSSNRWRCSSETWRPWRMEDRGDGWPSGDRSLPVSSPLRRAHTLAATPDQSWRRGYTHAAWESHYSEREPCRLSGNTACAFIKLAGIDGELRLPSSTIFCAFHLHTDW